MTARIWCRSASSCCGDIVYSAVDHKPKRGTRLRQIANVEVTGRACLLVDRYSEDWPALWWVRLDGRARVVDDPDEKTRAIAALVNEYEQYVDQAPTGPVLALDVTRWSGWSAAAPQPARPGRSPR